MEELLPFGVLTHTVVSASGLAAEAAVVLAVVTCFVVVHACLQRVLRTDVLRRHNDVAGYLFSAVGVLYAVVLGFVVVVVWQKYDGTVSNVEAEVNATGDLYRVVDGFTEPARSQIRADLRNYVATVIRIEWPALEAGHDVPETGMQILEDMTHRVSTFDATTMREFAAQQAAIGDQQRLLDARRERLVEAVPAVPSVLWFALVAGGLAMVAFCYIFGVENRPAQLAMTAVLVGFIGILFIVIDEFSTPFSGSVFISPDGWVYLGQRFPDVR